MNVDLDANTVMLYAVRDAFTPQTLWAYEGWAVALTADMAAQIPDGVGHSITVKGVVLPGYKRTRDGRLEWVMSPPADPIVAMFNAMPGPDGWVDTSARDTWRDIGLALLKMGVERDVFIDRYPDLYDAAVANYVAQQAA